MLRTSYSACHIWTRKEYSADTCSVGTYFWSPHTSCAESPTKHTCGDVSLCILFLRMYSSLLLSTSASTRYTPSHTEYHSISLPLILHTPNTAPYHTPSSLHPPSLPPPIPPPAGQPSEITQHRQDDVASSSTCALLQSQTRILHTTPYSHPSPPSPTESFAPASARKIHHSSARSPPSHPPSSSSPKSQVTSHKSPARRPQPLNPTRAVATGKQGISSALPRAWQGGAGRLGCAGLKEGGGRNAGWDGMGWDRGTGGGEGT